MICALINHEKEESSTRLVERSEHYRLCLLNKSFIAHPLKPRGGRDGRAISSDGILDVELTTPKELGRAGGNGTNPEQLGSI